MLSSIILLFIAWSGVTAIEPPEDAANLTPDQAQRCLLDDNCWIPYILVNIFLKNFKIFKCEVGLRRLQNI